MGLPNEVGGAVAAILSDDISWANAPIAPSLSKLKHFRRVATRYDKLAANFIAMVQLASIRLWLRNCESTA
ncbi:MAG: transposase [Tardiphaga sp.]|nr:transposase [Tardiphaga sp.]